jgi:hypothetical protein
VLISRRWVPRPPSIEPLLLGVYAWSITIASPSFEDRVSVGTRFLAIVAPLPLIIGWLILDRSPKVADGFAVFGFCGLNVCTLLLLGPARLGISAPTVQLTMGAVVWCLFSISWARTRNLVRDTGAQLGNTLDMTPPPPDPLASQLAIGLLGLCSAGVLALNGVPRMDGHGALVAALILVATLRLTALAGILTSRIEHTTGTAKHLAGSRHQAP